MLKYYSMLLLFVVLTACEKKPRSWQFAKTVTIEDVHPFGITETGEGIWVSDRDKNRLIRVDREGNNIETRNGAQRPMHIASYGHRLYIPIYNEQFVAMDQGNMVKPIVLSDTLNGPSGVWREDDAIAIADTNNHRILFAENGQDFISIGDQDNGSIVLSEPTDVQITSDAIWVADKGNNSVVMFRKNGAFVFKIAMTNYTNRIEGLFVSETSVFVTDFENGRILIFSHEGEFQQEISEGITTPTDLIVSKNQLVIANFSAGTLTMYDWKKISE